MNDRYSRQSFLGASSEALFRSVRAGIVGLGGGGSHIAQQSAHVGIGRFALFDPDFTDFPNLNRTVGATHADAVSKVPKVVVAERTIKGINPMPRYGPSSRSGRRISSRCVPATLCSGVWTDSAGAHSLRKAAGGR